jgi:hypothetical protein
MIIYNPVVKSPASRWPSSLYFRAVRLIYFKGLDKPNEDNNINSL